MVLIPELGTVEDALGGEVTRSRLRLHYWYKGLYT